MVKRERRMESDSEREGRENCISKLNLFFSFTSFVWLHASMSFTERDRALL